MNAEKVASAAAILFSIYLQSLIMKLYKNRNRKNEFSNLEKKNCRWMQQSTFRIGNRMESNVFDELMLIEIMITMTKLPEDIYGIMRRIIDRADEHSR